MEQSCRRREREETEHFWDVPGDVTANVVASPPPQRGSLKVNQSNATSTPVTAPESSTRGGQATVLLSGNKFKSKPKPIVNANANGFNGKVVMPVLDTA